MKNINIARKMMDRNARGVMVGIALVVAASSLGGCDAWRAKSYESGRCSRIVVAGQGIVLFGGCSGDAFAFTLSEYMARQPDLHVVQIVGGPDSNAHYVVLRQN